jgi:hypothetical protein
MKTIIEMAEEVGALGYVRDSGEKPHQWIFTPKELERFATLVIANHPPQSFMTWQEGCEAGKQAEREACAKLCEAIGEYGWQQYADAIRARGQA